MAAEVRVERRTVILVEVRILSFVCAAMRSWCVRCWYMCERVRWSIEYAQMWECAMRQSGCEGDDEVAQVVCGCLYRTGRYA